MPQLSCVMTRWLDDYIHVYAGAQTTARQLSVANYSVAIFSVPDFAFSKASGTRNSIHEASTVIHWANRPKFVAYMCA